MALNEATVKKLHDVKIIPVDDQTSRYSFRVVCSCGVQGHFYTKEDAEAYLRFHLDRKRIAPY